MRGDEQNAPASGQRCTTGSASDGDPFGTEQLRAATLDAWESSPTRLREDAETEADLRRVGYRDRVLTELVQNAADAADAADAAGVVAVWVDEGPPAGSGGAAPAERLHVTNTGAPVDAAGVASLCALRASDKDAGVGRFGVGFTATTVVADTVEVRSRTGSVAFSRGRTRAAVAGRGLAVPEADVPILRLPWPCAHAPADGWDTEVVLTLRGGTDAAALLSHAAQEAVELLLELPAVVRIEVDGSVYERTERALTVPGACGETARPADADGRRGDLRRIAIGDGAYEWAAFLEWAEGPARWIVPVEAGSADGPVRVLPVEHDVLRAPTRSDEELSLPALLIADVPMAPDRRRMLPGADPSPVASAYPSLVRAMPESQRTRMVPRPAFPLSGVDDALRTAIAAALWDRPWVPTAEGTAVAGRAAVLIPGLTRELGALLADVIDGLVAPGSSGPASVSALTSIGVPELGMAALVEVLSGLERAPAWWGTLYDALDPSTADPHAAEALGSIPVPLADGRTVTGPRTTLIGVGLVDGGPEAHAERLADVSWARLVHPAASHPLLGRLGAHEATARSLLADPELEAMIESAAEFADADADDAAQAADAAGLPDPVSLAGAVLTLAAGAGPDAQLPSWTGGLLVPDAARELRPVDELLVPGAPLADVLVEPSPFGAVSQDVVDEHGAGALRAVGAGWGFTLLRVELPTGPDHDLDDEETWWDGLPGEPESLVAVRDLDVVADDAWRPALELLLSDAVIRPLLADRDGYTAWWLRRHARVDGRTLGEYLGEDSVFDGLLERFDHPDAPALRGTLAGDRVDTAALASALLEGLADTQRRPAPAVVARAHRALAEPAVPLDGVPAPAGVRTAAGAVVPPERALVVDLPWAVAVLEPDETVPSAGLRDQLYEQVADVLGCALFSETLSAEVVSVGRESTWARESGAVRAARMQGTAVPDGRVVVHDPLVVRMRRVGVGPHGEPGIPGGGAEQGGGAERTTGPAGRLDGAECHVHWWEDEDGTIHVDTEWTVPLRRYAAEGFPRQ